MRRRRATRSLTLGLSVEQPVLSVRIEVGVQTGRNRLKLTREGPSGVVASVRSYDEATVSPGLVVVRDYEAPLGVPLVYTATTWNDATPGTVDTASGTVEIPDGGCADMWLTDLVQPTNTQRILVESLDELAYTVPIGVHDILGRRDPIVSGDVANTPTFELGFITADETARERARATLGNGIPVLLRTPPANGIGSLYFAVTGFREQRLVKPARQPERRFLVAAVQVARPDPDLMAPLPPITYAEVYAAFASYAELLDERPTYADLYYNLGSGDVGDVVPWPPSDV